MSRQGKLFIIAAPSGAGKTSLVNALVEQTADIHISISYTTRAPRPGETDGEQYHFIDETEYQQMVAKHEFLEHARVFNHYYGTGKRWVDDQLQQGQDVILEIDWQGAEQVQKLVPGSVLIFILPPSLDILHQRLLNRRQDKPEVIAERMSKNILEIEHYQDFDYLVVNNEFDKAVDDLKSIVKAERLRLNVQQQAQAGLLAQLLEKK